MVVTRSARIAYIGDLVTTIQDRKSTRLNSKSPMYLVCRLLLEKKKKKRTNGSHRRKLHYTIRGPTCNRNCLTTAARDKVITDQAVGKCRPLSCRLWLSICRYA